MAPLKPDNWQPTDLDSLINDVIDAVESGDIDKAFDRVDLTAGHLARSKNTRNYTKNYLTACLRAGVQGISEAKGETALGVINAYRRMNAAPPLDAAPEGVKVYAIKLPRTDGNPDVEIYIKEGNRVLYGEKVLPRGILTENFLILTGSHL